MSAQKTIFISILSGVEAKNLLRSNVIETILAFGNVKIILFVKSKERVEYYKKVFHHQNILYQVIDEYCPTIADKFFDTLRHYLVFTPTQKLYKQLVFKETGSNIRYLFSIVLSKILARALFRKLSRLFDYYFIRYDPFGKYFDVYKPSFVFLSNLFDNIEISLLRTAKKRGVRVGGYINSWDKITSKGFVRLLPDSLVVPNIVVKNEAIEFMGISEKLITVVGVPNYDLYIGSDGLVSREDFFNKLGINDSPCKLIIYAAPGSSVCGSIFEYIDAIHEVIEKKLHHKAIMLVRFQPNDFFESFDELKKRPWLLYDIPGKRFPANIGMDWDMTKEELIHLKNSLYHCSLLIAHGSSILIDAAVFDKPLININFEVKSDLSFFKQVTKRYTTLHIQKLLNFNAITSVNSISELAGWIDHYIENPAFNKGARRRFVEWQCWKIDGRAGQRIAESILSFL